MTIELAPLREEDGPQIIAANRAAREHHGEFASPCIDEEAFAAWLEVATAPANRTQIARTADGELVAVFNITQIALGNFRSAYLGYHGYPATAGRGLVTQAMGEVLRFAFTEIGLHRIEANVQPENTRSIALVQRAGFRKEGYSPRYLMIGGQWRDHERWAITVEDWTG